VRFLESWSSTSLAKKAVPRHCTGYFRLDRAFSLIEGHPAARPDKVAHATGLFWTKQHGVFAAAGIVSITENLARIVDSDGVGQRKTGAGRNESIEID
jgi:hypothetical protein